MLKLPKRVIKLFCHIFLYNHVCSQKVSVGKPAVSGINRLGEVLLEELSICSNTKQCYRNFMTEIRRS